MSAIIEKAKRRSIKWWIRIGSCVMLFVVIFSFTLFKTRMIIRGVQIVASIVEEKGSPIASIKGVAKNAVFLTLNGREIFIDKDGSFNETTALSPGVSVVTLSAKDKFGNTAEKKFDVVYKENSQVALINN